MREWEPFDSNNGHEDPWDFRKSDAADRRSLRRPEQHDADPDHAIGSCDDGVPEHQSTPAPRPPQTRQRSSRVVPGIVLLIIIFVVVGMVNGVRSIIEDIKEDQHPTWSFSFGDDQDVGEGGGDDLFPYDIEPGGDSDLPSADERSDETKPSNIEQYPALGDFAGVEVQ